MKTMNQEQAYRAMFHFMEKYYAQTQAEDIGILLGSMQLLADGLPADRAIWNEWLEAIDECSVPHRDVALDSVQPV